MITNESLKDHLIDESQFHSIMGLIYHIQD
jgi:hypothetical protein